MKVDTMRWIDRHIGVPLCFILKCFFLLIKPFFRKPPVDPQKILLIELSEMGSAILADPAMKWLKGQGKELHFVIFDKNAVSLDLLKTIPEQNIFRVNSDNLVSLALSSLKFLLWCRRKEIDTVIDLELFSRFTALLARLSGAANRVGFDRVHEEGLYRGDFLTHPVMYNPHVHISRNFMTLMRAALNEPAQPYQKELVEEELVLDRARVNEESVRQVTAKIRELYPAYEPGLQRLVLVNPNASDLLPQRRWMRDRFATVISELLNDFEDILVVVTGAPGEREGAEALRTMVNDPRCLNSAGVFHFSELVPLYSISEIMLSNDSGPPHFASVTGLKTFVIFGPETPALYGALGNSTPIYAGLACSPCVSAGNHRKTTCADNQCLKVIQPVDVLQVIRPSLEQGMIIRASA